MKKKYKVLKPLTIDSTDYAVDAIVELDDETAASLLAEEAVVEFVEETEEQRTAAAAAQARTRKPVVQIRSATPQTVQTRGDGRASGNRLVTAMRTAVQTRAAADYAGTELTDIMGLIAGGNVLFPMTTRVPIRGNLNIVYADWSGGNPSIGLVAECDTDENEVDMAHYIAIPGKYKATVAICSEYLEDNDSMDAFVREALNRAAGIGADVGILTGAFTNSIGLRGIIGDTTRANTGACGDTSTAITRAQLDALIGKVYAETYQDLVLAFNPVSWNAFVASLDPTKICCDDIVTGKNPSYRGWPVKLTTAVPVANKVVIGDFSRYLIGVNRAVTVQSDTSAGFAEDSIVYKVTCRLAGGIAGSKDAAGQAFFAYGLHTPG